MKSSLLLSLVAISASGVVAVPAASSRRSDDAAQLSDLIGHIKDLQLDALEAEGEALRKRGIAPKCTIDNVAIRKE